MTTTILLIQATFLLILIICSCPYTQSRDISLHRQKRGFRLNSASRVAHGYGKRGYETDGSDVLGNGDVSQLARETLGQLMMEDERDDLGWSIMSVEQLAKLIQTHPKLTRALVKKYIDVNDDNVITADELFDVPSRK